MIGGTRNNHWLSWAGLLVISGAPLAWGQPTTPVPPASVPEATLSEARSHAQALEKGLPKPKLEAKPNFD
ncbi:MAG: hypothetical protein U0984_01895, partial [Prosthecobacter sp.]|nr:hypothetical protein [Prosthecobacter sp.]